LFSDEAIPLENVTRIRIGILGAAKIVPLALIDPAHAVPEVEISAVAARDSSRAYAFAHKHKIPRVHENYDALLDDPDIDAIYNPLPNSLHATWTIKALEAGKHVLCEKPFASNAAEAAAMCDAAERAGLVLSEAFAYRYHPLAAQMKAIVQSGELGKLRHIEAHFCFPLPIPGNIRWRYDLSGGSLMDAGCYPVSLVRWLAGSEPTVVRARAIEIRPQVDRSMTADLQFENGCTGRIVCSMLSHVLLDSSAVVVGDTGKLSIFNPYHPHYLNFMRLRTKQGTKRERIAGDNVYVCQLRAFAKAIRGEAPLLTGPDDALANMRVIDAIYDKAGLKRRGT
jgi:predicted dehydrogenase